MKFSYMLAPLEDNTNNSFRELCHNHGADLTFTEMARLTGLVRKNKATEKKIAILNDVPTQIQLAGQKEEELIEFLKSFEPSKGFSGINFNIGCPSPGVIKQGLGCAMIKRVTKVSNMVRIVKEHGYPCSIKMRLGQNFFEKQKKDYLNLIENVDADFFVVHARHGNEHYDSMPDYSVFPECVAMGKKIIANGEVDTPEKIRMVKEMGVEGAMIGRAAVRNPAIFERLKGLKETGIGTLREEYNRLEDKYYNGYEKYRRNIMQRLGKEKAAESEKHVRG